MASSGGVSSKSDEGVRNVITAIGHIEPCPPPPQEYKTVPSFVSKNAQFIFALKPEIREKTTTIWGFETG